MTLKQYHAFLAVAKYQSFSEAAEKTGLSQPTLSRLLKQLEDEMQVELIDRYHRPLQLTKTGEYFYKKLDAILKELDSLTIITKKMGTPANTLNLGFVPSILYGLLPEVIANLKKIKPDLEIQLKDISSYQQVSALKSGEIDIGFGRFEILDSQIKQILLRHERYILAIPHNHPLANLNNSVDAVDTENEILQEVHLKDVVNDSIILYHQTHLPKSVGEVREPILNIFHELGLTPHNTVQVSDLQVALGLVAAGTGVTLVPDSLKNERTSKITYKRIIHENATAPIYIQTLKALPHPASKDLLEISYQLYEERGITYKKQEMD